MVAAPLTKIMQHDTSPRMLRTSAAKPNRPARFDDDFEPLSLTEQERFKDACVEIGRYISAEKECTVGQIRRAFIEHTSILWDVLKNLRLMGLCDFNDNAPAPTKITSSARSFVKDIRKRESWNGKIGIDIKPRNPVRQPDSSVYEGR